MWWGVFLLRFINYVIFYVITMFCSVLYVTACGILLYVEWEVIMCLPDGLAATLLMGVVVVD